jgi:endonuclease I
VSGLTGYNLKTGLYHIIKNHTAQTYGDLWTFYNNNESDKYYENDGSVIDIYSESPNSSDPYNFTLTSDQCGNYSGESDCYNREHSFPRSWFGGEVNPMNTDVHHIFPTDGYVNSKRSSYPYGEVSSSTYSSQNGSLVGSGTSAQGYTSTVFEPIDEFKGDLARAYFYMATRYENIITGWENNSTYSDAVLNGSSDQVFESWMLALLKKWHNQDPVSQKELDRNIAAEAYQGNRNPFVDHPEFVTEIWGN